MTNQRRFRRLLGLTATLASTATVAVASVGALGVGPAAADAGRPTDHQHARGHTTYVDCSARAAGDGSRRHPFSTLAAAGAADYRPGDRVLFRRGVTCTGTFQATATGTAKAPVTISDYGRGHRRAVLDGAGAPVVLHLLNSEHVVVDGLEITNPAAATPIAQRGITVELRDFGTGSGYTIRNTYIHDVLGTDVKGPQGSQGIAFQVTGTTVPTTFDGVRILDNRLDNVNRQGINVQLSTWSCRAQISCTDTPNWRGARHVVVRGNHLSSIGGDGMVLNTTEGALVDDNVIEGFNVRSTGYNAGLWTYNSNGFTAQHNDVSGGFGTRDSMAYDIDGGSVGATFQYNLSHDNDGGFFLFCPINGPIRDATVRYNLSVDDAHRGIENCRNEVESAKVYNNTIVIGDGVSQVVVNEGQPGVRRVDFTNNIVHKVGSGTATFNLDAGTGYRFASNILSGAITEPPANPGGSTADPRFCRPAPATTPRAVRGFAVRSTSPALRAGQRVAHNGGRDFFGRHIGNPPSIGAADRAGC